MKRLILLNLVFVSVVLLHAQSIEQETRNVAKLLKQNNYTEAIKELKRAIAIVEEEKLSQMKAELLPEKVLDYLKASEDENMESTISKINGKRIELVQVYTKPLNNTDSFEDSPEGYIGQNNATISVSISNDPGKMYEIANAHSTNNTDGFEGESMSAASFNGYRAIYSYSPEFRNGRLAVIVGGAVMEIRGENIGKEKVLYETAEMIELEKCIHFFGR
ncbi:MAG: hypothetical protein ACOC2F_06485 [Bacteroidota bacterium]